MQYIHNTELLVKKNVGGFRSIGLVKIKVYLIKRNLLLRSTTMHKFLRVTLMGAVLGGSLALSGHAFAQTFSQDDPNTKGWRTHVTEVELPTETIVVEETETINAPQFFELDTNDDGYVDEDEFVVFQTFTPRVLSVLDKDGDTKLTEKEYKRIVDIEVTESGDVRFR